MISPDALIIKSTDCPIAFDIRYGRTAISARNHPPKRFKCPDTFAR